MGKPHKHAEVIKAWADGATIQFRAPFVEGHKWKDTDNPSWTNDLEYRVKPQPKQLWAYPAMGVGGPIVVECDTKEAPAHDCRAIGSAVLVYEWEEK